MLRLSLAFAAALLAAGCTTPPIVYSPKDGPGDDPSGTVRPLRDLVASAARLRLVFMHGVGDHCPGYAIDPEDGWLHTKAMESIGLSYVPSADEDLHLVNVSVFTGGGKPDDQSHVTYVKRQYRLKLIGAGSDLPVEAIEITWSPLTQWIKSNQLGYDSPSTTPATAEESKDCVPPADSTHPAGRPAPKRLWLDRIIKEQVFDRNLADAILYSGTYGWVMDRGVSEALCRAVTSWGAESPCQWPPGAQLDDGTRYVFVTHSLGSRMLYDTFLDLLGRTTAADKNPFEPEEQRQAAVAVRSILARTAGLYMMANQLSLLGLASVPHSARSSEGMVPYFALMEAKARGGSTLPATPEQKTAPLSQVPLPLPRSASKPKPIPPAFGRASQAPSFTTPSEPFGDVVTGIARAAEAARAATRALSSLEIVSFNDTNDLLTWHIPPWYAVAAAPEPGKTGVNFVNVFVQNAPKLLIVEEPTAAHGNYFAKLPVWQVIACGAAGGRVRECPR